MAAEDVLRGFTMIKGNRPAENVFISVRDRSVTISVAALKGMGNPERIYIYEKPPMVAIVDAGSGNTQQQPKQHYSKRGKKDKKDSMGDGEFKGYRLQQVGSTVCRFCYRPVCDRLSEVAGIAFSNKGKRYYGEVKDGVLLIDMSQKPVDSR